MGSETYVGVSGFSYPGWKGTFYPEDVKSDALLEEYCKRLSSVEINSSFYAPPSVAMVKGWASRTTDGFKMSFKAPKMITHIQKLAKGASEGANRFSGTLEELGRKRGATLIQLPPYSKQDLGLLERFLAETEKMPKRVFEFRHESWLNESTYKLLDDASAAFCIVDTEDFKTESRVTGGLAYFRLRKDKYDREAMREWAAKIKKTARGIDETYVYLRHDDSGTNAVLAQQLAESLA